MPHWRTRTAFSGDGRPVPIGCANAAAVVKCIKPEKTPRYGLTAEEEQQRAVLRESNVALTLSALGLTHVVRLYAHTTLSRGGGGGGSGSGGGKGAGDEAPDSEGQGSDERGPELAGDSYALVLEHCELGSVADVVRKLAHRWVAVWEPELVFGACACAIPPSCLRMQHRLRNAAP